MKIEFNNITTLSKAEQLQILDWRNSESVRANMINQEIISKEAHLDYCEKLKNDKTALIFRVSVNETPRGLISFKELDHEDKTGEFGIYVVDRSNGVGISIGRVALYYYFEYLKFSDLGIMVLPHNKRAILYYEKILLFKDPYVKEGEFLINGIPVDAIHYSMDCRYWKDIVKNRFKDTINKTEFVVDGIWFSTYIDFAKQVCSATTSPADNSVIYSKSEL